MSVATVGELRIEPFASVEASDPLGTLVGTGRSTGDATGGDNRLTFNLPNDFFYVLRHFSAFSGTGAGLAFQFQISTGFSIGGIDETYVQIVDSVTAVGNAGALMTTPRIFWRPPTNSSPQMAARITNTNGLTLDASCRLLFWPADVLRSVPVLLLAPYLV